MSLDHDRTRAFVQRAWDAEIIPALTEYIRIPAKSPMFDAGWAEHGHIDRAVSLITDWAAARKTEGLKIDVIRLPGRTPVILMEAPGVIRRYFGDVSYSYRLFRNPEDGSAKPRLVLAIHPQGTPAEAYAAYRQLQAELAK